MDVEGLDVEIVRKDVRTLRIGVYPPEGRVRVSAPLGVGDEAIRGSVVRRLDWIEKHRERFRSQIREGELEYVEGELILFRGELCPLRLVPAAGRTSVSFHPESKRLELRIQRNSRREEREKALYSFFRAELKREIPLLIAQWEPILGVNVAEWGIKRMKTRWGTCNPKARRVWINLELAKRPPACLEFVLVHELAHLIEKSHDARFKAVLDRHLPAWRAAQKLLKSYPLV
jgi:predicted metal-dependent hydrolase